MEQPWIEKYRPRTLADISAQSATIETLQSTIRSRNLPHLLYPPPKTGLYSADYRFYGPPGTGKTSAILALARDVYGETKGRVLELNASDDRGIDAVRGKIKDFAKTVAPTTGPPYKLIILDEADAMSHDAQSALRRTMETYSKTTRFCLICNYITRIIDPLASRCAKFRFKPLDTESITSRLMYICEMEQMNCQESAIAQVVRVSGGDLRKSIMLLQNAKRFSGDDLTPEIVNEIAGWVPATVIQLIVAAWESGDVARVQKALANVFMNGYSGQQILLQIHEICCGSGGNEVDLTLTGLQKAKVAIEMGKIEKRMVDGASEHLQLFKLFTMKV